MFGLSSSISSRWGSRKANLVITFSVFSFTILSSTTILYVHVCVCVCIWIPVHTYMPNKLNGFNWFDSVCEMKKKPIIRYWSEIDLYKRIVESFENARRYTLYVICITYIGIYPNKFLHFFNEVPYRNFWCQKYLEY